MIVSQTHSSIHLCYGIHNKRRQGSLKLSQDPYRADLSQRAFIRKWFRRANSSDSTPEPSSVGSNQLEGEATSQSADIQHAGEESASIQDETTSDAANTVIEAVAKKPEAEEEEPAGTLDEASDPFGLEELFAEVTSPQDLGKRGEIWVIGQILCTLAILFPPLNISGMFKALGWISCALGVLLMGISLSTLGRSLSPLPLPRENSELVTSGVYGLARHPMYGGLLLGCIGLSIITMNEVRFLVTCLLWWLVEQKSALEERALEEKFKDYADYKVKVKKFFPFLY